MRRALTLAICTFRKDGRCTERYQHTDGPGAPGDVDQLLFMCFGRGARSGAGLRQRISNASRFLAWPQNQELPIHRLSEWSVATASEALQCKTGASRALSSLRWIESAFCTPTFTRSAFVSEQVHRKTGSVAADPPAEAKCPDEEHACGKNWLLTSSCLWFVFVLSPIECFAGATSKGPTVRSVVGSGAWTRGRD